MTVAERFQLTHDHRAQLGLERAMELVRPNLQACEIVVVPDAADAEPERSRSFQFRPPSIIRSFSPVT